MGAVNTASRAALWLLGWGAYGTAAGRPQPQPVPLAPSQSTRPPQDSHAGPTWSPFLLEDNITLGACSQAWHLRTGTDALFWAFFPQAGNKQGLFSLVPRNTVDTQ